MMEKPFGNHADMSETVMTVKPAADNDTRHDACEQPLTNSGVLRVNDQVDCVQNELTESHAHDGRSFHDHGFAWVVVGLSFFLIVIYYSSFVTYGIYMLAFQEQFENSEAFFAWVYGFSAVTGGFAGVVAGTMCNRFGTRTVAVMGAVFTATAYLGGAFSTNKYVLGFFYAVIAGFGESFLQVSATVATQQYFNKKRGLANGLIIMGGAVAFCICPPVAAYVTKWYGWRASFLLQSALALHGIPAGMLLRPPPIRIRIKPSCSRSSPNSNKKPSFVKRTFRGLSKSCQFEVLKNVVFDLLNFGVFFFASAHEIPIVFAVSRAVRFGIPREKAAFIMSAWAISSIFGRGFLGWLGDKTKRGYVMAFGTFISGVTNVASIFCNTLSLQFTYGAFYGFFSAAVFTLSAPTFVDVVGIERLAGAEGIFVVVYGAAGLIGPPLAEFLIESTRGFTVAFLVAGLFSIAGGAAMAFAIFFDNFQKRKDQKRTSSERTNYDRVTIEQEDSFQEESVS